MNVNNNFGSMNNKKINNLYINNNTENNSDKEDNGSDFELCENTKSKLIFSPMHIFNELYNSSAIKTLLAIGNRPAPLSLVGYFLNCLGNLLVYLIKKTYNKNILLNKTKVKRIKIYNNGEFGILISKNKNGFIYEQSSNLIPIIKSKTVILSSGGKQDDENPFFKKIQDLKGINNVFGSDYLLKEKGYTSFFIEIINGFYSDFINFKREKPKKRIITIIGGSHSGFSCSWILTNFPASYENIKIGNDFKLKIDNDCKNCKNYLKKLREIYKKIEMLEEKDTLSEEIQILFEEFKEKINIFNNYKISLDEELLENIDENHIKVEINNLNPCNCLGNVNNNIWNYKEFLKLDNDLIKKLIEYFKLEQLKENIIISKNKISINKKLQVIQDLIHFIKTNLIEINILYRDHIKVFYPSEIEAIEDNYTCYNKKEAFNKQGKLYPFIGIRGDAKEVYRSVIKGEEKRIKFIQTATIDDQIEYVLKSDFVIWACGYNTNNIEIVDHRNTPVEFYTESNGMIDVSKNLNIINKNKELIKNLFGIGQGYSTKTPEIINGKKGRADSIHLYNTHISKRLYYSLKELISKNTIDIQNKSSNSKNNLNALRRKIELSGKNKIEIYSIEKRNLNNFNSESKNNTIKKLPIINNKHNSKMQNNAIKELYSTLSENKSTNSKSEKNLKTNKKIFLFEDKNEECEKIPSYYVASESDNKYFSIKDPKSKLSNTKKEKKKNIPSKRKKLNKQKINDKIVNFSKLSGKKRMNYSFSNKEQTNFCERFDLIDLQQSSSKNNNSFSLDKTKSQKVIFTENTNKTFPKIIEKGIKLIYKNLETNFQKHDSSKMKITLPGFKLLKDLQNKDLLFTEET